MKFKVIIACACLLSVLCVTALSAQETWQGNASVSVRGELDRDGYYAASNSFPPGTKILVTNLANARTVVVTVRQRLNGASNVFLMLSSRASLELGMNPTDIARIKTQVVGISTDLTGGVSDFAYNRDTDTNPAYGTPDAGRVKPDNGTTTTQVTPTPTPAPTPTPTPTPLPTPTPYVDTTVTQTTPEPQKDRFAAPSTDQEADVSQRRAPARVKDTVPAFEMAEAKIPINEKAQAVFITRPQTPASAETMAAVEPVDPQVKKKETAVAASADKARVDEYRHTVPEGEEVLATLIEPTEQPRSAAVNEEGTVTVFERPSFDRDTVVAALNDPEIQAADRPFIWELHDVRPAGEELALAEPMLPEIGVQEKAAVDTYVKRAHDTDRLALDSYILPELTSHEKAEINALSRTEPPEDTVSLASHQLPRVKAAERPEILQRSDIAGRDKKEADLALVPAEPKAVIKPKLENHTTTITVVPDHTTTTRVEPDHTGTVTTTIWDTTTDYTRNFYYLQLGVFSSRATAEKILRANPTYPMMIVNGKSDSSTVYKVVVGPLKRDETGTVLYLFKARGYRDAFLRYIE